MVSSAGEDEEPTNSGDEGHNRDANEEEEERDVDARDQEGDGIVEDEERDANAEAQQSEPPHKPQTRNRANRHGAHSDWVSHKQEGANKNEEAGWSDCQLKDLLGPAFIQSTK